jgi:hypothetical protein
MQFLAQDTSVVEATTTDSMQEIFGVIDDLVKVVGHIVTTTCTKML